MTSGGVTLLQPGWLWLLPALVVVALVWRLFGEPDDDTGLAGGTAHGRRRFTHPLLHLIPRVSNGYGGRLISHGLLWLVLSCLVAALSQPVRLGERRLEPSRERDIVFIVDTSLSMVLRDYILDERRVGRIDLLKNLLKQFVHNLQGERISIIVFGESANTLVPLTRDKLLLTSMISRISAGMSGRFNALGDAIALAVREAGEARQRSRILVLFTDAGQHTGSIEPQAAARLAAEAGLHLYTIAIGAASAEAREHNARSGLLYQTVDTALLNSLASITRGESYQAGDSDALEKAVAAVTRHKENVAEQKVRYAQTPLYPWPLIAGLLLFTLRQALNLVRSSRR